MDEDGMPMQLPEVLEPLTVDVSRSVCHLTSKMLSLISMVPFALRHGKTFRLRHFFGFALINIVFFHLLNHIASLGYTHSVIKRLSFFCFCAARLI